MGTKGTWKRPAQVSETEAQASWDRIFPPKPFLCPQCGYYAEPTVCTHCGWVQIAEPPATE